MIKLSAKPFLKPGLSSQLIAAYLILIFAIFACTAQESGNINETQKSEGIRLLHLADSTESILDRIQVAHVALNYNQKIKNDSLENEAIYKLGTLHIINEDDDSAVFYLEQALTGFQNLKYKNREIAANGALIRVYRFLDDKENASRLIFISDRIIASENKPDDNYIFYYLQKAGFYYSMGLQDSTLAIANYADSLASTINSVKYQPQIKSIKGVIYAYLKNDKLAIQNYKSTLSQYHPYERDKAIILTNLGNAYARLGAIDSSLFYFNQVLDIYKATDVSETTSNKLNLDIAYAFCVLNPVLSKPYFAAINPDILTPKKKYFYYYIQSEYAITLQEKIKATGKTLKYAEGLELRQKQFEESCHNDLYNYHSELGNFKQALIHFEQYNILNAEMKAEETTFKMKTLDIIYDLKEKDQKIINQDLLITKKNQSIKAQKQTLYLSISIAFLLLIILFILIQNYKRKGKINTLRIKQNRLKQKLLIKEMDPISFQLGSAIETLEIAKQQINKIKQEENKNEINDIKILLNQWLISFNEKNSLKKAQDLIESDFLDKLNEFPDLTESEKNIIILIKQNYKTKEIATRLNLAQNTVEIYRSRIRKKLGISHKEQLSDKINEI